jgi:hypothetical protein
MDDGSGTTNGTRFGITEAAHHGDECTALLGVLQRQRDLVAWKLRDVPDDVLGAVATPTGMGLHGLVRHLTKWSARGCATYSPVRRALRSTGPSRIPMPSGGCPRVRPWPISWAITLPSPAAATRL